MSKINSIFNSLSTGLFRTAWQLKKQARTNNNEAISLNKNGSLGTNIHKTYPVAYFMRYNLGIKDLTINPKANVLSISFALWRVQGRFNPISQNNDLPEQIGSINKIKLAPNFDKKESLTSTVLQPLDKAWRNRSIVKPSLLFAAAGIPETIAWGFPLSSLMAGVLYGFIYNCFSRGLPWNLFHALPLRVFVKGMFSFND